MSNGITMKKSLLAFTILFIISFVLLSGCLGTPGGAGSSQTAPNVKGEVSGTNSYGSAGMPLSTPSDSTAQYSYPVPAPTTVASTYTNINDRKVIMTASVEIETGDHDRAVNSVRSIATGASGYIESSSTWVSTGDRKQTTMTLRVPQSAYESALSQIEALGKVKSESSSGQDVTRQYVDLNARLKNLQAEEKQLGDIMAMSKNVSEVLSVEKELYRVRGDIETTQAELNYLGSQVGYSTITVTVSEPQPVVGYDWGLDTAFKDAAHGFISMIGALIVITGYLIPLAIYFVIAAAIVYIVIRVAWNLYKKRKAKAGKP